MPLLCHNVVICALLSLVPSEDVLLTTTQLPKMSRARLAQAVPFALEDELIADVDTLHFAVSEYQSEGSLRIAVVAHDKMKQWLTLLQSWQIKPDYVVPSIFALPFIENSWTVALTREIAIVRTGAFEGVACYRDNLSEVLLAVLTVSSSLLVRINNYTNLSLATELQQVLLISIEEECLKEDEIIRSVAEDVDASRINLLQGIYAVKKTKLPQMNKIWKLASGLAIAWVALLFLYPTISYFVLKHRMSGIDTQIAEIYKRNFPQANNVVAPKLRIQEKLQNLNEQMGENRVLLLLGYLGKGMSEIPNIKLSRFDFQNNQVTLELTASTSEDLSAFTNFLTQQGLNVNQQNAVLNGSRVNTTLIVD